MDDRQIDSLVAAIRLALEGDLIEKIVVTIRPKPKPKPTK